MSLDNGLIYIVDDNKAITELLEDILKDKDFTVETFSNSEDVLQRSSYKAPDLFLLDIAMPGMNGITLCKTLKVNIDLAIIPVIFITGLQDIEEKVKSFKAGAADYITKPLIPIDVISRVRTQIKLKKFIDKTISFNTTLEKEIEKRTIDLEKSKEEAERANREKEQFLSNINHELRTPLNGIMGMLELMKNKNVETDDIEAYLDLAHYSAKQLSRLINDILDYTQLGNNSLHFQYNLFSLEKMIKMLNRKYVLLAKEKGLKFQINTSPEHLNPFAGDENRILQILDNLITNSIKYSIKGCITVSIQLNDELILTVEDQGFGIPLEKQDDVFSPYVQVQPSYIKDPQGLGLGLAITKDITNHMDGMISLQSTSGGTTVTVRIPPHKVASECKMDIKNTKEKTSGRILVIEDDTVSLYYLEQLLEEAGYSVITAINAKEAESFLEENIIDAVLLDIGLPHISGLQIMENINNRNLGFPVIAVTAYCQEEDILRFKKMGINNVIPKPVESKYLLNLLNNIISVET